MVYNDIIPGFPWQQAFDFAAGTFPDGSSIRADFKKHPLAEALVSVQDNAGVIRDGDRITIVLTGVQTAALEPAGERVMFDFVRTPDETHLGLRVTVPLSVSVTEP